MLKDMDMDMLRVLEDGSYAIGVKDDLDLTSVLPDLGGMGHVDDIKVSSNMTIPMFKGNMNVDLGKFEVEVKDDFEFVVLQSSFASDAVTGVETIMFEDACLDISFAFSNGKSLPPRHSTLESLCFLVSCAVSLSPITAARTPSNLFAAMLIPIPVLQISIPRSTSPFDTAKATLAA